MLSFQLHEMMIFRSVLQGRSSHKFIDLSSNPIMSIYYTNKMVLFFMCCGNEAFYASLYLLHFSSGPLGWYLLLIVRILQYIILFCVSSCRHRVVQIGGVYFCTDCVRENYIVSNSRICCLSKFGHY